ncbi:conserved hypothetical protein [Rippkaea orientalis PCC 8801]|uniref:Uncharacterized protein n=1 Tax=Rippkaea orientalis (strain PCC 8801 / RF-1) TaxID=41431 RepID=B7K1L7_RIPO1|nr:hypothetical protein [Rippkaea orientalis]ACK67559.1 conserved hypothetical protein [Rippkaea orientalis PCC 8801]
MLSNITISGKILGRNKSLFPDWNLSLDSTALSPDKKLTLSDLLTYIVKSEVSAFRTRQEQRRLISVLSQEAINEGALRGKIDMGGKDYQQVVDETEAIETALQGFEDGFYYVFIDDQQIESLEQLISLKEDSQLLFLRLVPLVGG